MTCERCGGPVSRLMPGRRLCGYCMRQCAICNARYDPADHPGAYCPECTLARIGRQHHPHSRGLASDERIAYLADRAARELPLFDEHREDHPDE